MLNLHPLVPPGPTALSQHINTLSGPCVYSQALHFSTTVSHWRGGEMLLGAPNLFRPSIQLTQSNPSFTNCSGSSAKRPIRHLKASFQAARISHQHRKFTLTAAMFHLLMFSFRCCATEHVSDSCHLLHFLKSFTCSNIPWFDQFSDVESGSKCVMQSSPKL